jgi:hypothetical protein
MSKLSHFINQLDDLAQYLCRIFPNDASAKSYYNKLSIAKKINPRKVLNAFLKLVYPHKEYIMQQNDEFFLTLFKQQSNGIANYDNELGNINFDILWTQDLTNEIRNTIWSYFKTLCVLMERVVLEDMNN